MARILPLLALVPTIFTFVAIILIEIGGVSNIYDGRHYDARHTQFGLLRWNYTVSPNNNDVFYSNSIYLNRQCYGVQTRLALQDGYAGSLSDQLCNSDYTFTNESYILVPDNLLSTLRPFRFDAVHSRIPSVLYIISAVFVFLAMLPGFGVVIFGWQTRGPRLIGAAFSLLSFFFLLVASAVMTWQTLRLGRQVRHDTLDSVVGLNPGFGSPPVTYSVQFVDVSIDRTVQGLAWGAVVAMLIASAIWTVSLSRAPRKELPPQKQGLHAGPSAVTVTWNYFTATRPSKSASYYVNKKERHSTSPSDHFAQSGV